MSFDSATTSRRVASARLCAALLESQRRVLERIAYGAPLEEILETLVGLIEEQADGMLCAVLLADAGQQREQGGQTTFHGASYDPIERASPLLQS